MNEPHASAPAPSREARRGARALVRALETAWRRTREAQEMARLSPHERARFLTDTWAERRREGVDRIRRSPARLPSTARDPPPGTSNRPPVAPP